MKEKIRTILNFFIIFVIIILLYIFFVITIGKMIPTYEEKVSTHENEKGQERMQMTDDEMESYIKMQLVNETSTAASYEDVNAVLENQIVRKIVEQYGIQELNNYLIKMEDTDYGDIFLIYHKDGANKAIFTKDMKNIYLLNQGYFNGDFSIKVGSETNQIADATILLEKISQKLQELSIELEYPLTATTIYSREYDISNTYFIEDKENHLVIIYDVNQDRILRLTLGFSRFGDFKALEGNLENSATTY